MCPSLSVLRSPPPTLPPADLYKPERDGPEEPDWFLKEKEFFSDNRDINKDGYLDKVSGRLHCFFLMC